MSDMVYEITLKCWNCGQTKNVLVNHPPQFAYELASIAHESGMYGVIDMYHSRSLVFCNEECANNQKTKKGTFRLRPKKIKTKEN